MNHSHEDVQSVISYGSAGLGAGAVWSLEAVAGYAESVTLILACAVVFIRLVYDLTRFVRYLRKGKN